MSYLYYLILILFVFFTPFIPDEKISRHKLFFMESAILISWLAWVWQTVVSAKVSWRKAYPYLPVLIYGVVNLVFYGMAGKKIVAQSELVRILSCLGIFFVVSLGLDKKRIKPLIFVWLISASLIALYGILQHSGGFGRVMVPKMDRVYATFGNPIFFAGFLVISMPFFIAGYFWTKKNLFRLGIVAGFGICLAALNFTSCRAAWLGFFSSLLVFVFLSKKSLKFKLILLAGMLSAGAGAVFLTWEKVWLRPQAHLYIWRDALRMWLDHPFIGSGLGTFHIDFPGYASEALKKIYPAQQFIVNDAHSEYVQTLAETGVIGLAVFFWVICSFYLSGVRLLKQQKAEKTKDERIFVLAALASGTGILAQNFFSVDMRFIISAIYFFFVFGLIVAFSPVEPINLPRANWFKVSCLIGSLILGGVFGRHIYLNFSLPGRLAKTPDFFKQRIENVPEAVREMEKGIKENPNQAVFYEKLGWIYSKEKNWPQAIANFEKALALDPNRPAVFNNLGNVYFEMNNRAKAKENYLRSLQINSGQVDAHFNLGYVYFMEGQLDKAAEEFRQTLKIDPNHTQARVILKKMVE